MKEIPLTKGKVAIVDDDMYDYLMQWEWSADYSKGKWYARRRGNRENIKMHRLIIQATDDVEVDHKDGDGLHNWRKNLRICTHAENSGNRLISKNNTSGYKGVKRASDSEKWQVSVGGQYVGCFNDLEAAGIAYNHAALLKYGEFARFNDIPNWRSRTPQVDTLFKNNTSGFRGVNWNRHARKWRASIGCQRKRIHIGSFNTPEEAARAYDEKAKELFGEFARTNF